MACFTSLDGFLFRPVKIDRDQPFTITMNLISSTTLLVAAACASVDAANHSQLRAVSFAAADFNAADESDAGWGGGGKKKRPRGSATDVTDGF